MTFRENFDNSLALSTKRIGVSQGYFLRFCTNKASQIPSKAAERSPFSRNKGNNGALIEPK
jgi:hypothetical protein